MPRPIGQVDLVAQQRVADVLHVHADLMSPARRASAARCTRPMDAARASLACALQWVTERAALDGKFRRWVSGRTRRRRRH
jgi:hypothetical protein